MKVIICDFENNNYPIGIGDNERMVFISLQEAERLNEKLKEKIAELKAQRGIVEER